MMILLDTCLTLLGTLLFYLTSPNQQWLSHRLSHKWRWLAYAFLLVALVLWINHLTAKAGVFTSLVLTMLFLGAYPLLSLLRNHKGDK